MLYAEYQDEEVFASEFPNELADLNTCADGYEDYPKCPDCGSRVTHRDESSDGRAAHFAHCNFTGGGGGDGERDCSGPSVGESQEHKAMKSIATSAIEFALDDLAIDESDLEVELPAPYSEEKDKRVADCLIEFEDRDEQLGEGLIIETQYANKTKDKESTTLDYLLLESDYSVMWLWESDFQTDADLPQNWNCKVVHEQTVRDRVQRQIWPPDNPHSVWTSETHLPPIHCDHHVPGLSADSRMVRSDETTEDHIQTIAESGESHVPATLPPEWHMDLWQAEPWEARFDPPADHTDIWCYSKVPATISKDWVLDTPREHWENSDWSERFRGDARNHLPDAANRVAGTFHLRRWLTNDEAVLNQTTQEPVAIADMDEDMLRSTNVWLIPESLFSTMTTELQDVGMQPEPAPPETMFDDVQCRICGAHWHVNEDREKCPTCEAYVDLEWNIETGRINESAVD